MSRLRALIPPVLLAVGLGLALACTDRPAAVPETAETTRGTDPGVPPTATPATPPEAPPTFADAPCPVPLPAGASVTCGYVTVPARQAPAGGQAVSLAVAVARAGDPVGTPLFVLGGGPGASVLANLSGQLAAFSPLMTGRDVVFFDQRGVGFSRPGLDCPEVDEAGRRAWLENLTVEQELALTNAAAMTCRERLVAAGINLAAFTTGENARDVDDLRRALGYDRVDLYGISYGTRLALRVLSLPDADTWVRSAVLDSPMPPGALLLAEGGPNFDSALEAVAENCRADTACGARFPDLKATILSTAAGLAAKPLTVRTADPLTRQPVQLEVNQARFLQLIFWLLYRRVTIAELPRTVERAGRGFGDGLAPAAQWQLSSGSQSSEGMGFSVLCADIQLVAPRDEMNTAAVALDPVLADLARQRATLLSSACRGWDVPADPGAGRGAPRPRPGRMPARAGGGGASRAPPGAGRPAPSPVPVLILAGEYDPATPPDWGRRTAAELDQATLVVFPGATHSLIDNGGRVTTCAVDIVTGFLARPGPDPPLDCLAEVQRLGFITR